MKHYSFYSLNSLMVMAVVLFAHILSSTNARAQTSVSLSVSVKQAACATSVQELSTSKSSDLHIFPNPASSLFVIERENTPQGSSVLLSLVNTRGEIVWTAQEQATTGGKWRKTVSTEHIAAGAYILTIEIHGQRESRSVMIK